MTHVHDQAHHPPVASASGASPAMPAPSVEAKDDPRARELLRRASEKNYRWPAGFGGFRAELAVAQAGLIAKGRVEVRSPREVSIDCDNPSVREWLGGQISMMAAHRASRRFEETDGKYVLTLGEDDGHPMGRLLKLHGDGMNSRYRILGDHITQVTRDMGQMTLTINVEDSLTTQDDRHLTTRYVIYYFSPADRSLMNAESFADRYAVVDGVYLPAVCRVSSVTGGELLTRELRFTAHELLSRS